MLNVIAQVEVWDLPGVTLAGGVCLDVLRTASGLSITRTLKGDGTATFSVPLADRGAAFLRIGRIAVIRERATGTVYEFRISEMTSKKARGGARTIDVVARELRLDLTMVGTMYARDSAGRASYAGGLVSATWNQYIATYIVPFLASIGYGWLTLGAVEDTNTYTINWAEPGLTPTALLDQLSDESGYEWILERTATSWQIAVRLNAGSINPETGTTAPLLQLIADRNLIDLLADATMQQQVTVVQARGTEANDGYTGTVARAVWQVTAVVVDLLTLGAPPAIGGAGPIIEDGQFTNAWLYRVCAPVVGGGGCAWVQITGTTAATNQVSVGTGLGAYFAVGDQVEIRLSKGITEWPDRTLVTHMRLHRVNAAPTGTTHGSVVLDDPYVAVDAVPVDNDWKGWTARVFRFSSSTTVTGSAGGGPTANQPQFVVGSTAGMLVGDVLQFVATTWVNTATATPWGVGSSTGYGMRVVSIIDATHVIVARLWTGDKGTSWYGTLGASLTVLIFRAIASSDRIIESSTAATNVLVLDTVVGIAQHDQVWVLRTHDGTVLSEWPSPAAITAYGRIAQSLTAALPTDRNILSRLNPAFRTWTGGASADPDRWTSVNSAKRGAQRTAAGEVGAAGYGYALHAGAHGNVNATTAIGGTTMSMNNVTGGVIAGDSLRLSAGIGNEETCIVQSVYAFALSATTLTLTFTTPFTKAHTNGDIIQHSDYTSANAPSLTSARVFLDGLTEGEQWWAVFHVRAEGMLAAVNDGAGHTGDVGWQLSALVWDLSGGYGAGSSIGGQLLGPADNGIDQVVAVPFNGRPNSVIELQVVVSGSGGLTFSVWPGSTLVCYIKDVMLVRETIAPTVVREVGPTALAQAAGRLLVRRKSPPTRYEGGVRDFARLGLDPTAEIVHGQAVRLFDPTLGIDTTLRVIQVVTPDRPESDVKISLDTEDRDVTLAELLAQLRSSGTT